MTEVKNKTQRLIDDFKSYVHEDETGKAFRLYGISDISNFQFTGESQDHYEIAKYIAKDLFPQYCFRTFNGRDLKQFNGSELFMSAEGFRLLVQRLPKEHDFKGYKREHVLAMINHYDPPHA